MFTIEPFNNNQIKVIQGDTGVLDLFLDNYQLKDRDKVYFTVKKDYAVEEALIFKEVDRFIDGKAKFIFTAEDTNLAVGTYLYDVQCNLADGRVDTVITASKFKVLGGITDV